MGLPWLVQTYKAQALLLCYICLHWGGARGVNVSIYSKHGVYGNCCCWWLFLLLLFLFAWKNWCIPDGTCRAFLEERSVGRTAGSLQSKQRVHDASSEAGFWHPFVAWTCSWCDLSSDAARVARNPDSWEKLSTPHLDGKVSSYEGGCINQESRWNSWLFMLDKRHCEAHNHQCLAFFTLPNTGVEVFTSRTMEIWNVSLAAMLPIILPYYALFEHGSGSVPLKSAIYYYLIISHTISIYALPVMKTNGQKG